MAGFNGARDEEKAMELEALSAIYEGELKLVAEEGNMVSYQVHLKDIDALLSFKLDANYPDVIPAIKVHCNGKDLTELEEELNSSAADMQGEIMIHNLIEEAKQWASTHKDEFNVKLKTDREDKAHQEVCKFFLEGKCKFGDKCFNTHELAQKGVNCDMDSNSDLKTNNITLKTEIMLPSNDDSSNSKKKSMKTATDVISRILWDEQLKKSDFCVGYLDRFIGIMERPFSEFSWEDLASVDYNVLAIPKHRIQYFKHKGKIVWDKRERIDCVFGSTGSGETILDVIQTSDQGDQEVQGDAAEDDVFVMEEVVEDFGNKRKMTGGSKKNTGPNFFIAFKINDAGILDRINELQQEIIEKEPLLADGFIPPQHLHITLLMLTLNTDDQITQATTILKQLQHVVASILPPTHQIQFKGVASFRDRILYVDTAINPQLQKVVTLLRLKFQKAGICLDGNKAVFHPHLTILRAPTSRISQARCRDVFTSFKKSYTDVNFGAQGVESIILHARFETRELDGTHKQVLTLVNSLLACTVCSTLPAKLLTHLNKLYDDGKCDSETKADIEYLLYDNTAFGLDKALMKLGEISSSTDAHSDRLLVVMRGIPGCGKTFLLDHCAEAKEPHGLTVCGTKQLFHRTGNNSKLDESEVNIAEAYCRTLFIESLATPVKIIAIDDCHQHSWQYAFYQKLAHAFGITCRVLEIMCSDSESIQRCHNDVTSGINLQELLGMVQDWEPEPDAVCLDPWFRNPRLQEDAGLSLRDLLN